MWFHIETTKSIDSFCFFGPEVCKTVTSLTPIRQLVLPAESRCSMIHKVQLGGSCIFSSTFSAIPGSDSEVFDNRQAWTCICGCFAPSFLFWPCCVCFFPPISLFVCPHLAVSFTDRLKTAGAAFKAELIRQKSTRMFFFSFKATWKYICSIHKHSMNCIFR